MNRDIRLTVEERTHVGDQFDESSDVWEVHSVGSLWFKLDAVPQGEYTQSDQIKSRTVFKAESEYVAGMNSTMRLTSGERVFHVDSVVNRGERNRTLDWMLVEST